MFAVCCSFSTGNTSIIWHLNKDIKIGKKGNVSKEWTIWLDSVTAV